MGFLDRKQRILDCVLTEHGRKQYALGKLKFVHFSLHDDLVDYDPFIPSSGPYDDESLSAIRELTVEMTPMLEAPVIPSRTVISTGRSALLPQSNVFTAGSNYAVLPQTSTFPSSSLITARQHSSADSRRYTRTDMTTAVIHLDHVGDMKKEPSWYQVRIMLSASDGLHEVTERIDESGDLSYGPFMILKVDR